MYLVMILVIWSWIRSNQILRRKIEVNIVFGNI